MGKKQSTHFRIWQGWGVIFMFVFLLTPDIWVRTLIEMFISASEEPMWVFSTSVIEPLSERLSGLSRQDKDLLFNALPYLSLFFVIGTFVLLFPVLRKQSFFLWIENHPDFHNWLRDNHYSVPANFKEWGYHESRKRYELYLTSEKREMGLIIVAMPDFLAVTRREIVFRMTLASFFLFPFLFPHILSVFGFFDVVYDENGIIVAGMFAHLPVLFLTGMNFPRINDSYSRISEFRQLMRTRKFLDWCQKRGHSFSRDTDIRIFSEWADEFNELSDDQNP